MRDKQLIPIEKIQPNNNQPRKSFNEKQLFELAQSIKEHGLIQPIVVRKVNEGFEIVAGERRYRASIMAGYTEIEAIIEELSEDKVSYLALIENIQREDLSVIEEARAYQEILNQNQLNQTQLAQQLGKSQSTIANKIRLLSLEASALEALSNQLVSERHGRALLALDSLQQSEAIKVIIKNQYSVKQTEEYIERIKTKKPDQKKRAVYSQAERLAINTINHALKMVKDTGVKISSKQVEDDDKIVLHIEIARERRK